MDPYRITFSRSARKDLQRLPAAVVTRVFPMIEALATNPRPHSVKKIEGEEDLWRIRVGDYRVLYSIMDKKQLVDVIAVRHRSDAYRSRD